MVCIHCNSEFEGTGPVCPQCGTTQIGHRIAAAPPVMEASAAPPIMETTITNGGPGSLSSTLTVSGSSSIRSRLRPRSATEIIGEVFLLYRDHARQLLPLSMLLSLPAAAFFFFGNVQMSSAQNWSRGSTTNLEEIFQKIGIFYLTLGVFFLFTVLGVFVMTRAVSKIYLNQIFSMGEIFRPDARLWRYLGAIILAGIFTCLVAAILVGGPVGVMAAVFAGNAEAFKGDPGAGAGVILIAVLAAIVGALAAAAVSYYFTLAGPAAVIEGTCPMGSIRRSVALIKGFYWKGVGIIILCSLIVAVIQSIFRAPTTVLTFVDTAQMLSTATSAGSSYGAFPHVVVPLWRSALGAVEEFLALGFTMPISTLGIVLFYYDLRIRKEGFDLQMLAQQLGYGVEAAG